MTRPPSRRESAAWSRWSWNKIPAKRSRRVTSPSRMWNCSALPPDSHPCAIWKSPKGVTSPTRKSSARARWPCSARLLPRNSSATQSPIGQTITVGNTKLAVIGVFEEKGLVGNTDFDSRIYMPISVVFQKFTFNPVRPLHGRQHPHDLRGSGSRQPTSTTSSPRSNSCSSNVTM